MRGERRPCSLHPQNALPFPFHTAPLTPKPFKPLKHPLKCPQTPLNNPLPSPLNPETRRQVRVLQMVGVLVEALGPDLARYLPLVAAALPKARRARARGLRLFVQLSLRA